MHQVNIAAVSISAAGEPIIEDAALLELLESQAGKVVQKSSPDNNWRCSNGSCDNSSNGQQCINSRSCINSSNSVACTFPTAEP